MKTCIHGYPNVGEVCQATDWRADHIVLVPIPYPEIEVTIKLPDLSGDDDDEEQGVYAKSYVEGLENDLRHLQLEHDRWREEAGILQEVVHHLQGQISVAGLDSFGNID